MGFNDWRAHRGVTRAHRPILLRVAQMHRTGYCPGSVGARHHAPAGLRGGRGGQGCCFCRFCHQIRAWRLALPATGRRTKEAQRGAVLCSGIGIHDTRFPGQDNPPSGRAVASPGGTCPPHRSRPGGRNARRDAGLPAAALPAGSGRRLSRMRPGGAGSQGVCDHRRAVSAGRPRRFRKTDEVDRLDGLSGRPSESAPVTAGPAGAPSPSVPSSPSSPQWFTFRPPNTPS